MPAEAITTFAANETLKSHDPLVVGLLFVLGVVILMVAIAQPIMGLMRSAKQNGAENSKSEAESTLFDNLSEQLEKNTAAIEKLQEERNQLFEKALRLENEVQRLSTFEKSFESMRDRLNEKDRLIEARDLEIRGLNHTIIEMKDRLHSLELRLTKDERAFCRDCQFVRKEDGITTGTRSTDA